MRIVVGITGGIAAYKAVNVVRAFVLAGHDVQVIATEAALRFVGRPTLEHAPPLSELERQGEWDALHARVVVVDTVAEEQLRTVLGEYHRDVKLDGLAA